MSVNLEQSIFDRFFMFNPENAEFPSVKSSFTDDTKSEVMSFEYFPIYDLFFNMMMPLSVTSS